MVTLCNLICIYNAVVRLYYRLIAVFYNYFRLMEHDWLPGRILLRRRCSEFARPCGIVRKRTFQTAKSSLVRPTIVSSVRTQWIFPVQVRFFFQPRLLYLCSVSGIEHVLPFYYICRFWWLRHRQFGLALIPDSDRPEDYQAHLRETSRLVPPLLSQFLCSCLYIPTDSC